MLTYLSLVRPYLQSNASANKTGCWPSVPPTVQFVSWGQDHHTFFSDWDVGIDANVMYLSKTYPLLLETLVYYQHWSQILSVILGQGPIDTTDFLCWGTMTVHRTSTTGD